MVMPPSTAFTSSLEFLRSIFSFAWALMQFACQLSEAPSPKYLGMLLASHLFKDSTHINY